MKKYKTKDLIEYPFGFFDEGRAVIALTDILRKKYDVRLFAIKPSKADEQYGTHAVQRIEFTLPGTHNTVRIDYDNYKGYTVTLWKKYYDERAQSWWDAHRTIEFPMTDYEWWDSYENLVKYIKDIETKFDFVEENVENMMYVTKVYYS